MTQGYKVMIARFPHGASEHPDVTDYIVRLYADMKTDPRISDIVTYRRDDTPITMSRNHCLDYALKQKVDFLLMIDSDMCPDSHVPSNPYRRGWDEDAKPFFPTSFDFLVERREAGEPAGSVVAPYCGPPPIENVYVFEWLTPCNDQPEDALSYSLSQYSRETAARKSGITEVAAGPTGLMLMDMEAIKTLETPHTYYEWEQRERLNKASTEDVTFTRDMSLQGNPVFCNWDSWAGHWKAKCVLKPEPLTPQDIGNKFRKAVLRQMGFSVNGNTAEGRVVMTRSGPCLPDTVDLASPKDLSKADITEERCERSPAPAERH